jgi:hypothetical protein
MKMRIALQTVLMAVILISLGSSTRAQNQGSLVKTDTLSFNSPDSLGLRDFGPVSPGATECHTIYFKNTTSDIVVINTVGVTNNTSSFSSKPIPTLPVILLKGEIVSIAELCYTASNPTELTSYSSFRIAGTVGSTARGITVGLKGSQTSIDSLLFKPCVTVTTDNNSVYGPIIMDGDVSRQITITSNRHDTITIPSFRSYDHTNETTVPDFTTSGISFPYKLKPLETKTFNIVYSPRSNVPVVKYRVLSQISMLFGNCSAWLDTVIGIAIPPTADSISTALNAGSTDVLAMLGDNSVTTKTFHFTNTGSTNLKITAVSLKNGKSFAITDIQPTSTLPFVLSPGQSMSVTISMTTTSNGVYYDEVLITAENALISMEFQLQGLRMNGVAGVRSSSATHPITLYPNPTQGMIFAEFPGVMNAKLTVLDLLGNVITTANTSEKWSWNAQVPNGTYLLQLSGNDASGKPMQSNERFIIAK